MVNIRNLVVSAVAGLIFGAGWWIFVDGCAYRDHSGFSAGPFIYYIPGILATIGLLILNYLDNRLFQEGGWSDEVTILEKVFIVFAVIFHLAAAISCIWIYFIEKKEHAIWETHWQGISSIVQTILILIASFVWRFGLKDSESEW